MLLGDIEKLLELKVPSKLALETDYIGFLDDYDLNQDIEKIRIYMDLYPEYDNSEESTLILTHHKPLFIPKTPTYVLHSNWDIIEGGANEALAEALDLEVIDTFDKSLGIGRICRPKDKNNFIGNLKKRFKDIRVVGELNSLNKIAIVSGFGLKNPDYIKLAQDNDIDVLISGDMTQETAVLAINTGLSLIDLGHHWSEVPGLMRLEKLFEDTDLTVEVINYPPWESL